MKSKSNTCFKWKYSKTTQSFFCHRIPFETARLESNLFSDCDGKDAEFLPCPDHFDLRITLFCSQGLE
ncbi:hypothetical protein BOA8489_01766 [Boseongicola aestuarii]|uniref:Uncharacterized protein n=1 Tax=Boseongicola aestuarii TaxID=1470561 RepID=A0A238J0F5_9RHOB|nr:hypothetical protein BOA8489_01766 [Boseongicola aestuarii]